MVFQEQSWASSLCLSFSPSLSLSSPSWFVVSSPLSSPPLFHLSLLPLCSFDYYSPPTFPSLSLSPLLPSLFICCLPFLISLPLSCPSLLSMFFCSLFSFSSVVFSPSLPSSLCCCSVLPYPSSLPSHSLFFTPSPLFHHSSLSLLYCLLLSPSPLSPFIGFVSLRCPPSLTSL